jgi:hypothetical protein
MPYSEVRRVRKDIETFARGLGPDFKIFRGLLDRLKWPRKNEQFMTFVEQWRRYQGYFESAKSNDGLLTERAVTLREESLVVGDKVLDGTREIQRKADEEGKNAIWAKGFRRWILTSCRTSSTTADVRKVQAFGS